MAALWIKQFPPKLHRRLKQLAAAHHRSMTQEVLVLLEESLWSLAKRMDGLLDEKRSPLLLQSSIDRPSVVGEFGSSVRGAFRLTQAFLNRAKRRGRCQSAGRS